jgi:hypothetical protein
VEDVFLSVAMEFGFLPMKPVTITIRRQVMVVMELAKLKEPFSAVA